METFPQHIQRLLASLESLAEVETVLLADKAWSELALVQERAVVVVDRLVALMSAPGARAQLDAAVFDRVHLLIQDQGDKIDLLTRERAACAEELRALNKSQNHVRSLLPAYRLSLADAPGLSFASQA